MGLSPRVSSNQKDIEAQVDEELSRLITQLTNEINWHMKEQGLTRADLAGRMGVSPGRVSQVLSGGENLTLRTLASLATALDAQFDVELRSLKPVADSGADTEGPGPENDLLFLRADTLEEAGLNGTRG